jgi:hypothetical protein
MGFLSMRWAVHGLTWAWDGLDLIWACHGLGCPFSGLNIDWGCYGLEWSWTELAMGWAAKGWSVHGLVSEHELGLGSPWAILAWS